MTIIEFFDVRNIDHIKAYKELQKTGIWPNGFISNDIEFTPQWHVTLMSKLADAYIRDITTEEVTK